MSPLLLPQGPNILHFSILSPIDCTAPPNPPHLDPCGQVTYLISVNIQTSIFLSYTWKAPDVAAARAGLQLYYYYVSWLGEEYNDNNTILAGLESNTMILLLC